jgi:hypothetical protein
MTHDYHQGLEGYVEGAIFQDGCEECEFRAKSFLIGHMDSQTWARARERALKLGSSGLDKVSHCELPVLQVIGDVLRMERANQPRSREEIIAAAKVVHDERCSCDPPYLMSCPRMAAAILEQGRS